MTERRAPPSLIYPSTWLVGKQPPKAEYEPDAQAKRGRGREAAVAGWKAVSRGLQSAPPRDRSSDLTLTLMGPGSSAWLT